MVVNVSRGNIQSTLILNNWARCVNRINRQDLTGLITIIISKIYA